MTDVALHPLPTAADVDLFVLQAYEADFATALTLDSVAIAVLTPAPVAPPAGGGGGWTPGRRMPLPPPPVGPRWRPSRRHEQHHRAHLALAASMTLTVHPHGRRAEEELVLDLI